MCELLTNAYLAVCFCCLYLVLTDDRGSAHDQAMPHMHHMTHSKKGANDSLGPTVVMSQPYVTHCDHTSSYYRTI